MRIMKILVRDNFWYIGLLHEDGVLTLLDSSCFVHVLFRKKLYRGWVGWISDEEPLIVEPEVEKYHYIQRIGNNLYVLEKDSEMTPHIEGLDRFYV